MLKIRPKVNSNMNERYKYRHPDLVPRNVYLINGRMVNLDKMQKTIGNFGFSPIEQVLYFIKDTCKKIGEVLRRISQFGRK